MRGLEDLAKLTRRKRRNELEGGESEGEVVEFVRSLEGQRRKKISWGMERKE